MASWRLLGFLGSRAVAAGSTSRLEHGHPPNRPETGTEWQLPLVIFMDGMSNAATGGMSKFTKDILKRNAAFGGGNTEIVPSSTFQPAGFRSRSCDWIV